MFICNQVSPIGQRILFLLVAGLSLCIAAAAGIAVFVTEATWFTDPGPFPEGWTGYDRGSFTGLTFFTFFASPGAALLYAGIIGLIDMVRANTSMHPNTVALLLIIPAGLFGIVGFASIGWAEEVFKCGWIFCLTNKVAPEVRNERPEAGIGFLAVTSTTIFFSCIPIALAIITAAAATFISASRPSTFNLHLFNISDPVSIFPVAFRTITFGVVILFFFYVVSILPNNWEYMSAPRVAAFIAKGISPRSECPYGACPELEGAYFVSQELVISEGVVTMKLFPSSLFFYSYLFFGGTLMSILLMFRWTRTLLKRRIYGLGLKSLSRFTVGDLLGSIATIGMVTMFFLYWAQSHNYNGYWDPTKGTYLGLTPSERWGRTFGQLAVVLLSLLLIPASRHSFLHSILGTSWEAFLWAHRVLGYGMLLAVLAHMIAWYVKYNEVGLFPQEILNVPAAIPTCIDNFTVPLVTLTTFVLLISMGVLTLPVFRRRFFELFYYAHIFAAYSTIPAVLWHAQAGWEYMLPGLTIWFFDRISRAYRSATPAIVYSLRTFEGPSRVGNSGDHLLGSQPQLVEIFFKSTTLKTANPGQYVFINVPEVSLLEWHPFTISSFNQEDGTYSVHIKCMGTNTWTSRVTSYAKRVLQAAGAQGSGVCASGPDSIQAVQRNFIVKVDGPYGHAIPINDYDQIILVGGGIGITPCSALLQAIQRRRLSVDFNGSPGDTVVSTARESDLQEGLQVAAPVGIQRVALLWSLRDAFLVESLAGVLSAESTVPSRLSGLDGSKSDAGGGGAVVGDEHHKIYCTQKDCLNLTLPDGFKMECSRPNYNSVFSSLLEAVPADRTLVFACGPDAMVESALEAALLLGCHFHNETFEL